jgi:hypothetical protein
LVLNGDNIITPELNRIQVLRHLTEQSDVIIERLKKRKKKVTKKVAKPVVEAPVVKRGRGRPRKVAA